MCCEPLVVGWRLCRTILHTRSHQPIHSQICQCCFGTEGEFSSVHRSIPNSPDIGVCSPAPFRVELLPGKMKPGGSDSPSALTHSMIVTNSWLALCNSYWGHAVSLWYWIQSPSTSSLTSERIRFNIWDFWAGLCFPLLWLFGIHTSGNWGDTGMTRQLWPEQIWLIPYDIS